tara:strand:- start:58 stop:606 length:549 start_codon:yes stop_codon:yes gene_type:complete
MVTFRQLVNIFDVIANEHKEINGFHSGFMDEVDIQKLGLDNYPILHVEPSTATIDTGTLTYNFNLYLITMINEQMQKSRTTNTTQSPFLRMGRTDTFSNSLLILQDVISDFKQNLHLQSADPQKYTSWTSAKGGSEIILQLPITTEPFTAKFDNELTGWSTTLTLLTNNTNDRCIAPMDNPS